MTDFPKPTIQSIILQYPTGFLDNQSDDYIWCHYFQTTCGLQVKEITKLMINNLNLTELVGKQKQELENAFLVIAELKKEASYTWWQRFWRKK